MFGSCARILAFCFFVFLSGCAQKQSIEISLPKQDLTPFIKDSKEVNTQHLGFLKQEYLKRFFAPFDEKIKQNVESLKWGIQSAYENLGFGENLLPYTKEEIAALEFEANLDNYPSAKKSAIIVRNANLRVLPTYKPRFHNPKLAGEGFPFDYWQNSSIYLGTPVLITHYSRSKKWAYVESGFVSGWINVLNVGILDNNQVRDLRETKDFLVLKNDLIALYNEHNEYLESARIGMILPLKGSTKTKYETEIYVRNARGYAKSYKIALDKAHFAKFPMRFSSENAAILMQGILGEKYGWGGMFFNRDCSMFLRDVFSNFGIYLPRNSQAQIRDTNEDLYKDISKQNVQEKLNVIKQYGIPFASFLGMKGHIMLYIGEINGEVYVLHDVWGLRTLQNETQEGRKIIGKIAITSVEIGKNVPEVMQDKLLIERIYGMRNLFLRDDFND